MPTVITRPNVLIVLLEYNSIDLIVTTLNNHLGGAALFFTFYIPVFLAIVAN